MKKPYWGIWMLLAVAFVFFFMLSVGGNTSLGAFELRTAKMYEKLTYVEPEQVIEDTAIVHEIEQLIEALPAFDASPQRILLVGDSMLEGLSPRLAAYAKHNNHKLFTVIWYASSSKHWATTQTLEKYIQKYKPTYIFMALGTNELYIRNIIELREGYVKTIVEKMGDIPFVWIGPPNWKKDTGINDLLKKTVPEGKFFLTKGMKFSYNEDQIHPTRSSAARWMDSIVRWMPIHCKHQIKLDIPELSKARPDTLILMKPPKS